MGAWSTLLAAIAFEIIGTSLVKYSAGFTKPWAVAGLLICYGLSMYLLSRATLEIPVSVAYAIWSGVGIVALSLIGVFFFGESLDLRRGVYVGLILLGVLGLRLS